MKCLFVLLILVFGFHSASHATFIGKPAKVPNGGTGLASPGTNGNVLTSNGTAWVSAAPGSSSGNAVAVKLTDYTLASTDELIVYGGLDYRALTLPDCTGTGQKIFQVMLNTTTAAVRVHCNGSDYFSTGSQDLVLTENGIAVRLACAGGTTYYVY